MCILWREIVFVGLHWICNLVPFLSKSVIHQSILVSLLSLPSLSLQSLPASDSPALAREIAEKARTKNNEEISQKERAKIAMNTNNSMSRSGIELSSTWNGMEGRLIQMEIVCGNWDDDRMERNETEWNGMR